MNTLIVFSLTSSLLGFLGGISQNSSFLFKSDESKTERGKAVFNKIKFVQNDNLDVWEMEQSHHGKYAKKSDWDHIKIIVNTSKKPYQASFHQIKNGEEVEYTANCLRCHSSGPRLIRPSSDQILSMKQRVLLAHWNYKIKSYGEVQLLKNPLKQSRRVKLNIPNSHKSVTVKSCTACHRRGGPRAELTSFQKGTILYMLKNKHMPPWPYKPLNQLEKAKLLKQVYGI